MQSAAFNVLGGKARDALNSRALLIYFILTVVSKKQSKATPYLYHVRFDSPCNSDLLGISCCFQQMLRKLEEKEKEVDDLLVQIQTEKVSFPRPFCDIRVLGCEGYGPVLEDLNLCSVQFLLLCFFCFF